MKFSELIESLARDGEGFSLVIPEAWMQGRTTYGGLSAALSLEAALRSFPDAPPLRSAQVAFVGPAGGGVKIAATALRKGKSTLFVNVDLAGDAGLAARSIFAFGAGRPSIFSRTFVAAADVPGPDGLPPFIPPGWGPAFAAHFETALVKGARPMSGSREHDHWLWVRHRDSQAKGVVALLALADMPPPAVMPMFGGDAFGPISSINWTINFLTERPETRDGWRLLRTCAENAAEGYSSQDMTVWNRDGAPVAVGRQSVAMFL